MGPKPRFAPNGALFRDLRSAGRRYLSASPRGRFASVGQLGRGAISILGLAVFYVMLLSSDPGPLSYLWSFFIALCGFGVLATLCHDAAHGSLVPAPWVNRAVLVFGFAVFGISGSLWGWRHIHLHHTFPNVAGTDIDGEGSNLVRLGEHRPWRPWHRFQAYYTPFLYTLLVAHLAWVEDFANRRMGMELAPAKFDTRAALIEFVAVKAFHFAGFILIPWVVLQPPLWALLLGYWLATGTASILFVVMAAGTHLSIQAEFVQPDADNKIGHDWATHQLLTCVDWAPENGAAIVLTGGANAHAAHHLFPQMAHSHNKALSKIVSEVSNQNGVPHHVTTFPGMVRAHFALLNSLGRRPQVLDPSASSA